jgi:hypothetical protein
MNGKGDKRRPMDEGRFRENFDQINWRRPSVCPGCNQEIDPTTCHCGEDIRPGIVHDNHYPVPQGCNCFRDS